MDFISNYRKIQNFVSINSNFSLNQFQAFLINLKEELKMSMGNFKLKLFKPMKIFEVYFKEFEKISIENKKIDKKDPYIRPTSSNSNNKRPLTPEMEINEKNSHSKNHTIESYNLPLPFKNINKIARKNRQKSYDSSANRFMDFMQNKSTGNIQEFEDMRSSFNSNSDNRIFVGRNNNLIQNNNNTSNMRINDKTLANSLSLSEGFDLINNMKKESNEEKKNDFIEEKRKFFCKAKSDFQPKRKNELQFKKGDVIEIILISDDGWCQGLLNGKRGVFPLSFVEKLE